MLFRSGTSITSGTIATARLGSGTADATTFLRGDSTFAAAVTSVDGNTGAVTVSKATVYEFTRSSGPSGATWTAANSQWTGWSLPSTAKLVEILLVGAGGGGGSGRKGASSTARYGGGGGGAGGVTLVTLPASAVSGSLTITIPAGGVGGAEIGRAHV